MRAVAYCRVSTSKEEQLDSLSSQQNFFSEYALKNGYELVHIYADEGKSGTKIKNRKQLIQLLEDADKDYFDIVLIKDISRLARNTVDFLTSIRKLKALSIRVVFVNYDQTSSDSSEFMLTMLSAIAQEESANTSKRVRFGKKQNANLGRVPNLVYGYDKIPGDYFHLSINQKEKAVVQKIFDMYAEENLGTGAIAQKLNEQGIRTKRGCLFTQTGIKRILSNEIYIGNVVNGKEEVKDFLTGERQAKEEEQWIVINRPELRIISDETFRKTEKLLKCRKSAFLKEGKKQQSKYIFSQLLTCKECNASFRRITRTYKNTYHTWVCSTRNIKGKSVCSNTNSVDENELIKEILNYMFLILNEHSKVVKKLLQDYLIQKGKGIPGVINEVTSFGKNIDKLKAEKQKYIMLYTNDIISLGDLKTKISELDNKINIEEIKLTALKKINIKEKEQIELKKQDDAIEELIKRYLLVNAPLRRFLDGIVVDKDNKIDIYIKKIHE